ncbi:T6SS effector BTH_I2691 family protein [Hafnia paralvei]|uniref:T6SS effector BTH_I2691 family protein n=1 Tax=Hafnia paralvei TaxID=546367 RepID=UPI001CCB3CE9|nr:T6SS effector BTH_I2691 family protein [Hafnia paralvei]UBM41645.1 hypothetical protein K9N75_03975 [Hafnia paralvei]
MATTDNVISAKPCTSAKGRIPLVPVRYGIVPKKPDDTQQFAWEGCGFTLEEGFICIAELHCSKYTLRALRGGYVYTYMSSPEKGKKLIIHEHEGNGLYQELLIQNLEQYGSTNSYASGNISHNIWIEADATEVWVGYSPHLWTQKQVSDILSSIASRQLFMQPVDPAELVNCSESFSTQKNIMPLAALEQWVEEYKPADIRIDMSWSQGECYQTDLYTLKSMAGYFKQYAPKVPAVIALLDAEGIGIDTGSIAKLYAHQTADVKAQGSGSNLPLALQLNVSKLQRPSEDFYQKNAISELIFNTLISLSASKGDESLVDGERDLSHYMLLTDESRSKGGHRFAKRIDQQKFMAFLEEKKQVQDDLEIMIKRARLSAIDHHAWLKSTEQQYQYMRLSIACALSSYDRYFKASAYSLELSIAMIIDGAGFPLPGQEDKDPRTTLFMDWINDANSPLNQALLAYRPFEKDASTAGVWVSAPDLIIQTISKKLSFIKATQGTDIIAKNIQTTLLKLTKGRKSWDKIASLTKHVEQAIEENNATKLLGVLRSRYNITSDVIEAVPAIKNLEVLTESNMLAISESTKASIFSGPNRRDLKVITETEIRAKYNENYVAGKRSALFSVAIVSPGVLIFASIYLFSALKTCQEKPTAINISSFMAAGLGELATINAALVSVKNLAVRESLDAGIAVAGEYYVKLIPRLLASDVAGLTFGWGAIIFTFITDILKSIKNQTDGKYFRLGSAFLMLFGSALLLHIGGLISTMALIPIIGWVILGITLIGVGIWLGLEADERNHTPYEAWVNRTEFGILMADENSDRDLHRWGSLSETLQEYFNIRYKPIMVDATLAQYLKHPTVYSQWLPEEIISNKFGMQPPKFVLYFPDYIKGISDIRDISTGYLIEEAPQTNGGILLRFSKNDSSPNGGQARLDLKYQPNTGDTNEMVIISENKMDPELYMRSIPSITYYRP